MNRENTISSVMILYVLAIVFAGISDLTSLLIDLRLFIITFIATTSILIITYIKFHKVFKMVS